MRDLAAATEHYVAQTLHARLHLDAWPAAATLPPYLRTTYQLMRGRLGETPILWLLAEEPVTPKTLEKHIDTLAAHWPGAMVAVFRVLPAYVRQRLIQKGIAFVVPGTQLYLPGLGFDYRERSAAPREEREHLRPSAQLLLLYLLYRQTDRAMTLSDIVPELGYTLMTVSRGVAELEAAGLVETTKVGRSKTVRLAKTPDETWGVAQERLSTPVVRTVAVPAAAWGDVVRPFAGLCALAGYTMLQGPPGAVRAIGATKARELDVADQVIKDAEEYVAEDDVERTEIWAYDPTLLASGPAVDRLSLYLTLRDDSDERVQMALTELLEGMTW